MVLDFETTKHGFLRIRSIDFYGQAAPSPNGRFCLAWQDSDYKGKGTDEWKAGFRVSGMGRAVMIAEGAIIWQRDLERPNDGAVADTGDSIISDWLFGEGFKGRFYAFDPHGRTILRHDFRANLKKGGISPDAALAWCSTLDSPVVEDANKLVVFLLSKPGFVIKVPLPRWKINSIGLAGELIRVDTLHTSYLYSQIGELLNEDEIDAAVERLALDVGSELDLHVLWRIAEKRIEGIHAATLMERERRIDLLRRIAAKSSAPHYRALAERKLGEICLGFGDKEGALAHFRSALETNPKVGVKTAIQKLERELGD